jgi:hydrogenase maturation factor HypF (carbamoyltransferase family)
LNLNNWGQSLTKCERCTKEYEPIKKVDYYALRGICPKCIENIKQLKKKLAPLPKV